MNLLNNSCWKRLFEMDSYLNFIKLSSKVAGSSDFNCFSDKKKECDKKLKTFLSEIKIIQYLCHVTTTKVRS